jgi:hypothetical protein
MQKAATKVIERRMGDLAKVNVKRRHACRSCYVAAVSKRFKPQIKR